MIDNEKVRLILGDVDSIKSFVFESNALPDIRGGSELLLECEEEVKELLKPYELVYCGGGSFLAKVPAEKGEELKERIEKIYLEKTQIATITIAISEPIEPEELDKGVPTYQGKKLQNLKGSGVARHLLFSHFEALYENQEERKNFGEWISFMSSELQRKKQQKTYSPFFPTLPINKRCQACGKRAASEIDKVTGELLCSICLNKRKTGREKRRKFLEMFSEWLKDRTTKVSDLRDRMPKDLEELADDNGRIAFFYADGNNVGNLLQKSKKKEDYQKLSGLLSKKTKESLFKALWDTFGEKVITDEKKTIPFEIITIGGDDVIAILPGRFSWSFSLNFLKNFQESTQKELPAELSYLSASAGLMITDVKYPFNFILNLTEELLKKAKKLSRKVEGSTLCHLWLRIPVVHESADLLIRSIYKRQIAGHELILTARPFTISQAEKLAEIAAKLKEIPSSQRRVLSESLENGVHFSINFTLYQIKRQNFKIDQLEAFKELGKLISNKDYNSSLLFWAFQGKTYTTSLLDALELIELGAV